MSNPTLKPLLDAVRDGAIKSGYDHLHAQLRLIDALLNLVAAQAEALEKISGRNDFLKSGLSHSDWKSCDKFDFRTIAHTSVEHTHAELKRLAGKAE